MPPPVVPPQMPMQAPMRKYSDTRGCEGRFGGYRVNRNASTNSVNFTFKSAIIKEAANFRLEEAKQATLPLGMVWEPPKNKASTYKTVAAPGELSGDWVAFIAKAGAMSYDELVAYLIRDMNEALRAAQHLIERHAPSGIALLRKHNPEVTWRSFCSYTSLVDLSIDLSIDVSIDVSIDLLSIYRSIDLSTASRRRRRAVGVAPSAASRRRRRRAGGVAPSAASPVRHRCGTGADRVRTGGGPAADRRRTGGGSAARRPLALELLSRRGHEKGRSKGRGVPLP